MADLVESIKEFDGFEAPECHDLLLFPLNRRSYYMNRQISFSYHKYLYWYLQTDLIFLRYDSTISKTGGRKINIEIEA